MPFIKFSKNDRKKILVRIACLAIAVLAWIVMALSNKYIYTAKTVMIYRNLPQNRAFHPLQSDTIDLQIEGTGWQLIFARLRVNPNFVNINLGKLSNQNFILIKDQLPAMNKQLETEQKVISSVPDTLYFDFSKSYEKRIPIKLVSAVDFKKQYGLSDATVIKPEYVTVRGPQEVLKELKYWKTDTLKLKEVQSSTSLRLPLEHNHLKNINIFPTNVEVSLSVEEFTEKTIEVPLKIYNNVDFNDIALYPKKVSITFMVPLSDFKDIEQDRITAGVDMNDWKFKKHNRLVVTLKRFPKYCKLVKIQPATVDFIIEK